MLTGGSLPSIGATTKRSPRLLRKLPSMGHWSRGLPARSKPSALASTSARTRGLQTVFVTEAAFGPGSIAKSGTGARLGSRITGSVDSEATTSWSEPENLTVANAARAKAPPTNAKSTISVER